MCKRKWEREPCTHLQSDRQHTNQADEQRHREEPSSMRRDTVVEGTKTLEREGCVGEVRVMKRSEGGLACKRLKQMNHPTPDPHPKEREEKRPNEAKFLGCSVSLHPSPLLAPVRKRSLLRDRMTWVTSVRPLRNCFQGPYSWPDSAPRSLDTPRTGQAASERRG